MVIGQTIDWIIRGTRGEFWSIPDDIFQDTFSDASDVVIQFNDVQVEIDLCPQCEGQEWRHGPVSG